MTRPVQDIILQDYTLDIKLLSPNSRAVVKNVITFEAAATVGATTVSLTAASSTTIEAGTSVSFAAASSPTERQQVLFTSDATITSTATNFAVAPLKKAIADNSVGDFVVGTLPLIGIQTMDVQNQETQVDTTNFQSGSGTEMAIVRNARTLNISGIVKVGDMAYTNIIQKVSLDSAFINREIYAIATFPDGEKFEGAAKIMGLNMPANQNEVKKYTFNLTFLGDSFIWTPGYYAA
ncbi:MAG: phage tail tube protein [Dolichospermum sp.]